MSVSVGVLQFDAPRKAKVSSLVSDRIISAAPNASTSSSASTIIRAVAPPSLTPSSSVPVDTKAAGGVSGEAAKSPTHSGGDKGDADKAPPVPAGSSRAYDEASVEAFNRERLRKLAHNEQKNNRLTHDERDAENKRRGFENGDKGYYDEVDIDDMDWNEETRTYTSPCPCGDMFVVTEDQLFNGETIAKCPSCSLVIKVIYNPDDFLESEDEEGGDS